MSLLTDLFAACGDELARLETRARGLLYEADPSTTDELLPEHESELDLVATGTVEERRARALALTVAQPGYRPVDFQTALASLLGLAPADVAVIEMSTWTLTKTGGGSPAYDAGASSFETIAGDGYVEVTVHAIGGQWRGFGFSKDDPTQHWNTIEYGLIYADDSNLYVGEDGALTGALVAYAVGDILRVERIGTTIYYKKNGVTFYTSPTASIGALMIDTVISTIPGAIVGVRLVDAGLPRIVTWQNIVNVTPGMSLPDAREIFRFFVYRKPTLPGTWFITSAQELIDKIKPSHTLGYAIESINFLTDDPYSLTDRDLLGI